MFDPALMLEILSQRSPLVIQRGSFRTSCWPCMPGRKTDKYGNLFRSICRDCKEKTS